MAGQIPRHFIDDLLGRIDIVDVIEQRIKLKKSGANHSACCPFHSEKTPSFTVSQSKQFYHCFGCGAHGSAIGFLMEYENLHFVDAVEMLAEMAGLEVPREASDNKVNRQLNRSLYELMDACATHFSNCLRQHPHAIDYLKNRGLDGETAKRFRIGYAPDAWDTLLQHFGEQTSSLIATGMLVQNDNKKAYDRFRDRIMFPIRDRRGRVVAFGGRVLAHGEPKYLNSPETDLYHKGSELYGLYEGRRHAQDAGQIIVVEGYMDVIGLSQQGIQHAVATLGTATNQQHCENIFRVVPEILFCFDGDRAGREAAWRALQAVLPCLHDGRDAYFLFLPEGEDPDSLVRSAGVEGFNDRLQQKKSVIEFLFEHLAGDADLQQIGVRARLVEETRPMINRIPEGVFRELATRRLESLIGLQLERSSSNTTSRPVARGRQRAPQTADPSLTTMRRTILLLLQNPWLVQTLDPDYYNFDPTSRGAPILVKLIALCDAHPQISTGALVEHFRDLPEWGALNRLAATPYFPDGRELEQNVAIADFVYCIDLLNKMSCPREATKVTPTQRVGLLALRKRRENFD